MVSSRRHLDAGCWVRGRGRFDGRNEFVHSGESSSNGAKAVLNSFASSVSSSSDCAQTFQSSLSFIPRSEVKTILQRRIHPDQPPRRSPEREGKKVPSKLETERPPGTIEQPDHDPPIRQVHSEITLLPIHTSRQRALRILLRFQPNPLTLVYERLFDLIRQRLRYGDDLDVSVSALGANPRHLERDHRGSVLRVKVVKCRFVSIGNIRCSALERSAGGGLTY